ncbi:MAG: carbamate kinase [Gemmatimonadetes bacterium]|nr:MAG: carbamate kinase [Gemmatimonadota bacterium]
MRVVAALGGNALLRRGEPFTAGAQRANARAAAASVAALAEAHEVVVTHGNGPQVGLLAQGAGAALAGLDDLVAETEGMIGYVLEQELRNALPARAVATLLTLVAVDPEDPAFQNPTKPIGPVLDPGLAERCAQERGWVLAPDGDGWRRVVPSPEPGRLVDAEAMRLLADHGVLVICGGGGGIPVCVGADGRLEGVEAVIDKDMTAALVADAVDADALLMLTDVDAVYADWGTPRAVRVERLGPHDAPWLRLPEGSMGPKVRAGLRFVQGGAGRIAAIGALERALDTLEGRAGTRIEPGEAGAAPRAPA